MITVGGAAALGQQKPAWSLWLAWASVLVLAIGLGGAAVAMVATASPGQRSFPFLSAGVLAASVVVAAVLTAEAHTTRARTLRVACLAALVIASGVLFAAGPNWALDAKLRRAEPGITRAADAVLATPDRWPVGQRCGAPPVDLGPITDLMDVDGICITSSAQYGRELQIERKSGDHHVGLIYSPDRAGPAPAVMSTCLRHAEGPWWEYAANVLTCPSGFTFIGGG